MHNVRFNADIPASEVNRACYMCKESAFDPLLTVEQNHYLTADLTMVKCRNCGSAFFLGDDPVLGYDYEGFNEDY